MKITANYSLKRLAVAAIALGSMLGSANPSEADVIKFTFSGPVNNAAGPLFPAVNAESKITGNILVNSATSTNVTPGLETYVDKIIDANLTVSTGSTNYQFVFDTNPIPNQLNNLVSILHSGNDEVDLSVKLVGPPFGDFTGQGQTDPLNPFFSMQLFGPSGTFTSTDLTTNNLPPSLSSFSIDNWRIGDFLFSGAFNSVTIAAAPVPLPPAMILFGAGLMALVGLGAGHWWQQRPSLDLPPFITPKLRK